MFGIFIHDVKVGYAGFKFFLRNILCRMEEQFLCAGGRLEYIRLLFAEIFGVKNNRNFFRVYCAD